MQPAMTVYREHEKTPGQRAYEEDCRRRPNYDDGRPRPAWGQLWPLARTTWEKNPTPRFDAPAAKAAP